MKRIGYIQGSRISHREDWFPSQQRHYYKQDDFDGDILEDQWAVDVAGVSTVLIAAGQNGLVELTTSIVNDEHASMARELNLSGALYAGIEARLKLDDIVGAQIEMGLVDAKLMAQGRAFNDFDQTGGLPSPVATDGVVIGLDQTDSTIQNLCGAAVHNASPNTVNDLGAPLVNLTFVILRIQLDVLGTARYYINNALIATQLLAVDPAIPFTPWLANSNKAGNIRILTVDYAKWWQRRV